ncbi:MAG: hypothetical protein QM534_15640 [Sediminibacterium sp.]|nr:hypothetical protein [Sediminibacterium sp.]
MWFIRFCKLIIPIASVIGLSGCISSHKPFAGSSYSPVLVEKKKDLHLNTGLWLLKYAKADATYAMSDHFAIRGAIMTTYGLYQGEGSVLLYRSKAKNTFFSGVLFNFQQNNIKRKFSSVMFANGKDYQYDCRYYSPGLVVGWQFFKQHYFSHQIISKISYNMVEKYNYNYRHDNASGKQTGYTVFDHENLKGPIPDFFSIEPSYTLIGKGNRTLYFLQLGFNFAEYTYRHTYQFLSEYYGRTIEESSNLHPVHSSVNFTIGFILNH